MDKLRNHFENCNFEINDMENLIDLYNISGEIDSNRKVSGVDIFRNFEYGIPLKWLSEKLNKHSKILDIGSSSTIWPVLLLQKFGCQVYATDIDITHLENQKHYLYNVGKLDEMGKSFIVENQDATNMTYEDNKFDVVCSISAIEHIPAEGDIRAVEEAERVLKPGGIFILTAPFSSKFGESTTDHYHHGYEKRYDLNAIENRFSSAHGLVRDKLLFINGIHEDSDAISEFWYKHALYKQLGKISMFFSLLMFNVSEEPTQQSKGFMAMYRK